MYSITACLAFTTFSQEHGISIHDLATFCRLAHRRKTTQERSGASGLWADAAIHANTQFNEFAARHGFRVEGDALTHNGTRFYLPPFFMANLADYAKI
jgi:hypothetical protein